MMPISIVLMSAVDVFHVRICGARPLSRRLEKHVEFEVEHLASRIIHSQVSVLCRGNMETGNLSPGEPAEAGAVARLHGALRILNPPCDFAGALRISNPLCEFAQMFEDVFCCVLWCGRTHHKRLGGRSTKLYYRSDIKSSSGQTAAARVR